MGRPTLARAMWTLRPSLPELLLWTIGILGAHLVTGVPVLLLATAVLLIVIGGTLQQARTVLREATPAAAAGGEHAED